MKELVCPIHDSQQHNLIIYCCGLSWNNDSICVSSISFEYTCIIKLYQNIVGGSIDIDNLSNLIDDISAWFIMLDL